MHWNVINISGLEILLIQVKKIVLLLLKYINVNLYINKNVIQYFKILFLFFLICKNV